MNNKQPRYYWFSVLLFLPVVILYASHFLSAYNNPQHQPTGYINYDMPYYIANAREYVESDKPELTYPLPFSAEYNNERIYFHPQIFVIGNLSRFTGIDSKYIYLAFGFLFSILCIRICIILLFKIIGTQSKLSYLLAVLFIWGGGLLCFASVAFSYLKFHDLHEALNNCFILDPFDGWWFLNLGRNFIFPMEAYYHFLFFTSVYFIFSKEFLKAVLISMLIAISHPFTGISILIILIAWMFSEKIFFKNNEIKYNYFFLLLLTLGGFLAYNFIFLPSNIEHKQLMEQWTLNWSMSIKNYLPAYILVLCITIFRFLKPGSFKTFFTLPFNRFLLCWLIINWALENHNLFIKPHQPLHFTRGYVWSCLFLLGAPYLFEYFNKIKEKEISFKNYAPAIILVLLFFSDNIIWFSCQSFKQYKGEGITLTSNEKSLLNYLDHNFKPGYLLVSTDKKMAYLSNSYSSYRTLYSHPYNTPDAKKKLSILNNISAQCALDSSLKNKNILLLYNRDSLACSFVDSFPLTYQNPNYEIRIINRVK